MAEAKIERLKEELRKAQTVAEAAKRCGISISRLYTIAKQNGLSVAEYRASADGKDPTPEQIAERLEEVRKSWSPAEEQRRRVGGSQVRYEVPVFVTGRKGESRRPTFTAVKA